MFIPLFYRENIVSTYLDKYCFIPIYYTLNKKK